MKMGKQNERGFTLTELLVVIAIIGIIIAILLVNIQAARSQGRDETRLENIASLQLALGLYFDKYGAYPLALTCLDSTVAGVCTINTTADNFIGSVPTDPSTGASYSYAALLYSYGGFNSCTGYHLGTVLENQNTRLADKAGFDSASGTGVSLCSGSSAGFDARSVTNPNYYDKTSTSTAT